MSVEENAASASIDDLINESLNEEVIEAKEEVSELESATSTDEDDSETQTEEPKENGFQKRIDKITAEKYAEKRRADELQKKIDELSKSKKELREPKLDDPSINYDDELYNKAQVEYKVQLGIQNALIEREESEKAKQQQAEREQITKTFNEKVIKLNKPDFDEKAASIPNLPSGVADAIMRSDVSAEIVYHLGTNLSKADAIASMSPAMALFEVGKLAAKLSAKPTIKTSAAPDPIDPVKSGSTLNSKIDDEMSIDEWMAKFN